jgi:hypothetical protein
MKALSLAGFVGVWVILASSGASAQESKSAPLAKQLVAALEAAKLDSIAAKDPAAPDVFIGALYIQGTQLLVISGQYSAPSLLTDRIAKKEYRDVYIDLNGAATAASRVFVEDVGADGLHVRTEDNRPPDSIEATGKRTTLDRDWKRQKISEEDYMKAFGTGDERYAQMLTALLQQVK